MVLVAQGLDTKRSVNPATPTAAVESQPASAAALTQAAPAPSAPEDMKNWQYTSTTDEMTGRSSKIACTTSTNELDFDFPYNGGASGELCFRRKGKSLDAWLKVTKGQFACGIEDCVLKVKFDENPLQSYSAVESTSHTTGMLFFQSQGRLLTSALRGKQLKVQANYFEAGNKVLYFDVSGLDLKQL